MKIKRIFSLLFVLILIFSFSACKKSEDETEYKKLSIGTADDLNNLNVAVCQGTIHDKLILDMSPRANIQYYATYSDMLAALKSHKIDAFIGDTPCLKYLTREANTDCSFLPNELYIQNIGSIFSKETGEELCDEYNAFIEKITKDGQLLKLQEKWIDGKDETLTIDPSTLTNTKNRIIKVAVDSLNPPFGYIKDGSLAGYEVDIAIMFCNEMGYGIELVDTKFDSIIAGVASGAYDMGSSSVTITKERAEQLLFSIPTFKSGASVVIRTEDLAKEAEIKYKNIDELAGKRIAVMVGSVGEIKAANFIKDAKLVKFQTIADLGLAIESDKADALYFDYPNALYLCNVYNNLRIMDGTKDPEDYGFILRKNDAKGAKLCQELNAFIAKCHNDGTIDELEKIWTGTDEEAQRNAFNLDDLTGENGTINLAVSTAIGPPFIYIQDDHYAGLDINYLYLFCKELGYDLKIDNVEFGSIINQVVSGKDDLGASGISITEERAQSVLFTDSYYSGGPCIIVSTTETLVSDDTSFLDSIGDSFQKTFIREQRWKLFLSGIGSTMLITVMSIICGTALGFLSYMAYRKEKKPVNKVLDFFSWLIEGMPMVVFLMILFYIIFAKAGLSGTAVAIVGFSLTFATSVLGMLRTSVAAVDKGQTEAALALGYSPIATFFKIVLPQAAQFFLPNFKSEVVSLIKGTAVVGYIAVQDLTKMGDIVRSRTYDAFFPLIATAIIYFILAGILTRIISSIEFNVDPKRRDVSKLMKGDDDK